MSARSIPLSILLLAAVPAVCTAAPPFAPLMIWPSSEGPMVGSNRVDIAWSASPHDQFEVHIGSCNAPTSTDGWDSGPVVSAADMVTTPPLPPQQRYYVFVRIHNADGWSPWSAGNTDFYVDAELLSDPYYVAGSAGHQWPHSMAFNPDRNEYLVAYADTKLGQPAHVSDFSYWRLDAAGVKIGAEVTITDHAYLSGVHEPAVAYNSINHEYLIAYTGWTGEGTPLLRDDVRAQRVNAADGSPIGGSYMVDSSPARATYELEIGYSPVSNVYLVAWHDSMGTGPILARRLAGATGQVVGSVINVSAHYTTVCAKPNIAYNSAADEFMIMHQLDREYLGTGWDLYVQRLRASDGVLVGDSLPLQNVSAWDMNGDIAYDSELNRYLAVYESKSAGSSIWGQFINADATRLGNRFPVLSAPRSGGAVHVAWLPSTREYLAAWQDCCTPNDYARRIAQDGRLIGEPFRVNGTIEGIGNWNPTPVPNTVDNEFLVGWFCTYTDVYVRRYKTYPVPPVDTQPPDAVTDVAFSQLPSSITLRWTNPLTPDFQGAVIRFRTDRYPTDPTDGTWLSDRPNCPGTSDTYTHTDLARGTTYYYAVFAHDEVPNNAPPALASRRVTHGDFNDDGDVDQEDFGHLQACLSGEAREYGAGCADADLDTDGDVDPSDFDAFARCMAGAGRPSGC